MCNLAQLLLRWLSRSVDLLVAAVNTNLEKRKDHLLPPPLAASEGPFSCLITFTR